mgnify:CR=1 FL=1
MRTVLISLTAGEAKKVSVTGYYLTLLSAAAPVDLEVEMVGKAGHSDVSTGLPEGYGEQFPEMFNSITITSDISQTVKFGYAMGVVKVDRSTIVSSQAATSDNSAATLAATDTPEEILAADNTRRRLILTAHPDNTGTVLLGGPSLDGSGSNAARRLEPGDSWVDETAAAAAVWAAGTINDVICIEVAT